MSGRRCKALRREFFAKYKRYPRRSRFQQGILNRAERMATAEESGQGVRAMLDMLTCLISAVLVTAAFVPDFSMGLSTILRAHAAGFRKASAAYRAGWKSVRPKPLLKRRPVELRKAS